MRTSLLLVVLVMTNLAADPRLARGAEPPVDLDAQGKGDPARDFFVTLPDSPRPFPEPLPDGRSPGFRIRGIKGYNWSAEQYLAEVPVLARYKMNFLMNCYLSMYSVRGGGGQKAKNEWWLPLPEATRRDYEQVIRACRQNGIQFCLSIHPQLDSPRPLDMKSDSDFEQYWQHFAWAQGQGVKWFNVPIDDVSGIKVAGAEHARFANRLLERLHHGDPDAQLILCPTQYDGDGGNSAYLQALARDLRPEVYVFWTGDGIVTPQVTRRCAEQYKGVVKHRLILWDNYPVNDGAPTMHLGPLTGRAVDLGEVVDGYMSNAMYPQTELNRIPMLTCADYAYNPQAYDPGRSIGQAIMHLADTGDRRRVLKQLVEAYPGPLIYYPWSQEGPAYREQQVINPVLDRFGALAGQRNPGVLLEAYLRHLEDLSTRFDQAFPDRYGAEKKSLRVDINLMREAFASRYGPAAGRGLVPQTEPATRPASTRGS